MPLEQSFRFGLTSSGWNLLCHLDEMSLKERGGESGERGGEGREGRERCDGGSFIAGDRQ